MLPSHLTERFSLSMENATVRQALEVVAGETGIGYFIEPNGIRITANSPSPGAGSNTQARETADATVAALRSNSIVGQLTIPNADGTSFAFFLRESDLPPDVNELRKARVRAAAEIIRKALAPASQPQD